MYEILKDFFESSTGEGLSTRATSFLVGIGPTVIVLSNLVGHPITQGQIDFFTTNTGTAIAGLFSLATIVWHTIGWARRNFNKQYKLGKYSPTAEPMA